MKYRLQRLIIWIVTVFTALACIIGGLSFLTENHRVDSVPGESSDLTAIAAKETLNREEEALLWQETGLGKTALKELWPEESRRLSALTAFQRQFFSNPPYEVNGLTGLSKVNRIKGEEHCYTLFPLAPGDVLLTESTFTLCYRHGHSALCIGGDKLLEATVIGEPASITEAAQWGGYPDGIVLRISDEAAKSVGMTQEELGKAAADYAAKELNNDAYSLLAGILGKGVKTEETQCAYLIWEAYHHFGVNTSARQFPVTPTSLLNSGAFEVLQYWGHDPQSLPH